jgi:hypothetical protein
MVLSSADESTLRGETVASCAMEAPGVAHSLVALLTLEELAPVAQPHGSLGFVFVGSAEHLVDPLGVRRTAGVLQQRRVEKVR